jgi:hypothetical protein
VEPGFEEWIRILDIYSYYIGVYILIALAVFVLVISFLGCCAALVEHGLGLLIVSTLHTNTQIDMFESLERMNVNVRMGRRRRGIDPIWEYFDLLMSKCCETCYGNEKSCSSRASVRV